MRDARGRRVIFRARISSKRAKRHKISYRRTVSFKRIE
jgi:hypothetical protein